MPEYKYYQDEKDMVWQRHTFTVTATSESEADAIIRENGLDRKCVTDICDERINHVNSETLFETQSLLMPEENRGKHTLEVLTADKRRSVCNNIDDTTSKTPVKERTETMETCSVSSGKNVLCNAPKEKRMNLDRKILSLLDRGPLAALYLAVASNVLRKVVEQKDDQYVSDLFGGLINTATIRHCVAEIDKTLNYD